MLETHAQHVSCFELHRCITARLYQEKNCTFSLKPIKKLHELLVYNEGNV